MSGLVVFDSQYGNTQKVAEAVAKELSGQAPWKAVHIDKIRKEDLASINCLVVGSPTQGFTATAKVKKWLNSLPANSLKGMPAAAFDTRFTQEKINEVGILSLLVSIFGYGAKPIARRLAKKGAELAGESVGFYVSDTEGPLLDQELARAAGWADQLKIKFNLILGKTPSED